MKRGALIGILALSAVTLVLTIVFFAAIVPPQKNKSTEEMVMPVSVPVQQTTASAKPSSSGTASVSAQPAGKGKPPPPSPTPSVVNVPPTVVDQEILNIGAGVSGLTAGYVLSNITGPGLRIVDERSYVGGKVRSHFYHQGSTPEKPIWAVTHAEQFRGGDAILRCLGQTIGLRSIKRGTPGIYIENIMRGYNSTGYMCYGRQPPISAASCAAGYPPDYYHAPNGVRNLTLYDLPDGLCGNKDWTQCSYVDEIMIAVMSKSNANKIRQGETLEQYMTRILSADSYAYLIDNFGNYFVNMSAAAAVEYFRFDWTYPYGHISMPHGGPQVSLLHHLGNAIRGNGSAIDLNTKISEINFATGADASAGFRYTSYSAATNTLYRSNRLGLAFPAGHLADMSGTVVDKLKQSRFIPHTGAVAACTINLFFADRWWKNARSSCNYGWCAAKGYFDVLNNTEGNYNKTYNGWNFAVNSGPNVIDYMQFAPTEERLAGNFVRVFYDEDNCDPFVALYESGGTLAVETETMRRIRANLDHAFGLEGAPSNIPDPVQTFFSHEPFAYAKITSGADFLGADLEKWAAEPLPGEKIAFMSENFVHRHSGWQEGAAISAFQAMYGPVFNDIVDPKVLLAMQSCSPKVSTNGRSLTMNNANTGNDICLLLEGEYHMRDIMLAAYNKTYCDGPKEYIWPTFDEITGGMPYPTTNEWDQETLVVTDTKIIKGRRAQRM